MNKSLKKSNSALKKKHENKSKDFGLTLFLGAAVATIGYG